MPRVQSWSVLEDAEIDRRLEKVNLRKEAVE